MDYVLHLQSLFSEAVETLRRRNETKIEADGTRVVYTANWKDSVLSRGSLKGRPMYCDNSFKTARYTWYNFIFKNFFEQCRRLANLYFIFVAILQFSIDSPVNPVTSSFPLIFVMSITALKQGYEDWLRHKSDNKVNQREVKVLRNNVVRHIPSKDVVVGDVVLVENSQEIPCDLVLLSCDNEEGICFIDTANLDGETDLKAYYCAPLTKAMTSQESLGSLPAYVECQQPNSFLYNFEGKLKIEDRSQMPSCSLNTQNLCLRGSTLRNTTFLYGLAVYTGEETKMSLNLKMKRNKFSSVENSMNRFLLFFIGVLMGLTILTTLLWSVRYIPKDAFWNIKDDSRWLTRAFMFLILYNYIVPISLYVTVELQKFWGSMFISWDKDLFGVQEVETVEQDEFGSRNLNEGVLESVSPAIVNTSDLNEELGQIEHLFADKTGTLTDNHLEFRRCFVNGVDYKEVDNALYVVETEEMLTTYPSELLEFLLSLCVCHTVKVSGTSSDVVVTYEASSADEKVLLEASQRFGVEFLGGTDSYNVDVNGMSISFHVLAVLEFSAERKCMSVIVKDTRNGKIILVSKGSDAVMFEKSEEGAREKIQRHVDSYAQLGYRTLVFGKRIISPEEYVDFNEKFKDCKEAVGDRQILLENLYKKIECNLSIIGATGVEDRLQDGVQDTMAKLKDAGIELWVLTGDKAETAINISFACGHFRKNANIKMLRDFRQDDPFKDLEKELNDMKYTSVSYSGMVVDGSTLRCIMKDSKLQESFVEVILGCQAVLCCRLSPIQKSQIVRMIKKSAGSPITAAIGDGANDVAMIQEAHVGIGIAGKEGRQASRSADFALHRFRHLKELLLVHGHWYYIRIATLVQYFFYKNIIFIIPQFLYGISHQFSSQSIYDAFFLTFYNIFFTSLPVLLYGLLEQDYSKESLLDDPTLYRRIRKNQLLSWTHFAKWCLTGLWHMTVCYSCVYILWSSGSESFLSNGHTLGQYCFGEFVYHYVVIIANLKILWTSSFWTREFVVSIVLCSFIWYIILTFIYTSLNINIFDSLLLLGTFAQVTGNATTWLLLPCIVLTCSLAEFIVSGTWKSALIKEPRLRGDVENFLSRLPFRQRRAVAPEVNYLQKMVTKERN